MTFDALAISLLPTGTLTSPAELHGALCGRLCGGQQLTAADLLGAASETLQIDKTLAEPLLHTLVDLNTLILDELRDRDFVFQPLLPDDDETLDIRARSLATWCQGFLTGLGLSGLAGDTQLSVDTSDALRDLAAIAQADQNPDANEENEASFFALVEYVRMAVLLVYADLAQSDDAASPPQIH